MHLKIRRPVGYILLILLALILIIDFGVFAFTVDTNTSFVVENETYKFYRIMNFHTITIASSYIVFNTTGFYISSSNPILITLVYIHKDIPRAGDGKKVLEFYATTTSGNVIFSLSGFPAGNKYVVRRGGTSIATPTANSSGFISFSNRVWDSTLFEIFQAGDGVGNTPPVVSNIPDQTIFVGESFSQINLDNYVTDAEDPKRDIMWSYSGNSDLLISIVNRVATISVPTPSWSGAETIKFTATDKGGLSDSDTAKFTVTANNAPPPAPPPSNGDPPPSSPPPDDSPPSSPGGGGVVEVNNPPVSPINVTGPYFVEIGVEYTYTIATTDPEGDDIRYRVNWGNETISNWSAFVASGTPVVFSHSWSKVDTYQLFIIAQDIHGLNTSWNYICDIGVTGVTDNDDPRVRDFIVSENPIVNESIVFNATGIFDLEGIESYFWSFGDGTNGTGIITTHTYSQPDTYTVILAVTDEQGNTFSKSSIITVSSNVTENKQALQESQVGHDSLLISLGILIVIAVVIFLMIFFRKPIKSFLINYVIVYFPRVKVIYNGHIRKRLSAVKQKLRVIAKPLAKLNPGGIIKRFIRFIYSKHTRKRLVAIKQKLRIFYIKLRTTLNPSVVKRLIKHIRYKRLNRSIAKLQNKLKGEYPKIRGFVDPEIKSVKIDKTYFIGAMSTFFRTTLEKVQAHPKKDMWPSFEDFTGMVYISAPSDSKKNTIMLVDAMSTFFRTTLEKVQAHPKKDMQPSFEDFTDMVYRVNAPSGSKKNTTIPDTLYSKIDSIETERTIDDFHIQIQKIQEFVDNLDLKL